MHKVLITTALPYVNGTPHLGHIAGCYLPADIYTRFRRFAHPKEEILLIGGTDEYGVPVMLAAQKENKTEPEIVEKYHDIWDKTLKDWNILHDNFSGTARAHHNKLAQEMFEKAKANEYLFQKSEKQMYCPDCKNFLPDRYIEGECYHCGAPDARGDQCDSCGRLIEPEKLINPVCKYCGGIHLEVRESTHWFFDLPKLETRIKNWIEKKEDSWKSNVYSTVRKKWLEEGLQARSITRDLSWGIPVPGEDGKVLYVWFDAPIGYISSTMEYFQNMGAPEKWKDFWKNEDTELLHFVGKDNVVFHSITWPATLMAQEDFILPSNVPANEFLNLEGGKFSKSKNHAVWANEIIKEIDPDFLRYYMTTILPETSDADFSWDGFDAAINDLSNTLGNMANRFLTFSKKKFGTSLCANPNARTREDQIFLENVKACAKDSYENMMQFRMRQSLRDVMDIARETNRYFDNEEPWKLIKEDNDRAQVVLGCVYEALVILSQFIEPFIPTTAKKLQNYLQCDNMDMQTTINFVANENVPISSDFGILIQKPDEKIIQNEKTKLM